ncbi:MAG: ribonuclease HII [Candidatus Aenigmatarchaeota archaeon]|nr:ribonuclease HII [Candidatus Aenigmarchaeota archaeon]
MKLGVDNKSIDFCLLKGAVLGPLVVAGVTIDVKSEKKLKALGVKDSKELTPEKREQLYKLIQKIAKDIFVLKVAPCRIDTYRSMGINLDTIEAMKMAEIIDFASSDKVFIDSLTHNPKRFEKVIKSFVKNKNIKLVVDNYMDESNIAVSAASIVAKVERDKEIEELKQEVGVDFGIGYPHDPLTIQFIEKIIKETKGKELPDYIRKSWVTTEMLQEKAWQKKVIDFIFRKKDVECKGEE